MSRLLLGPLMAVSFLASAFQPLWAQAAPGKPASGAQLKVSGSFRVRYETIDGQARAGFNAADDLLNFRTRLAAEYDADAWALGGEFYDSRVYLKDRGTPVSTNDVNTFEPAQLYLIARFGQGGGASKTSVQVGRFTLNIGSRRLVASDDFRNTTNSYGGLKVDTAWTGGVSATGIYVLPDIRLPMDANGVFDNKTKLDRETSALRLWGGTMTVPFSLQRAALQPTYLHLAERDQADLPTRDRRLDTFALRYFREPAAGTWDFDAEAGSQTGTINTSAAANAPRQDVWATFAHAEFGYAWAKGWKPRLAVEYDWASGDKPGGAYNRFDTLFGMRRAEIAPGGLFGALARANISAPGLRLEITPDARWDAFATAKQVYLASDTDFFSSAGVRDATGRSGAFAGTQFDTRVRYWLVPQKLRLEMNLVYLRKGAFLRNAPNAQRDGDTKYGALDVTASF